LAKGEQKGLGWERGGGGGFRRRRAERVALGFSLFAVEVEWARGTMKKLKKKAVRGGF